MKNQCDPLAVIQIIDKVYYKYVPVIYNINDRAENYNPLYNRELLRARRDAITPSHQFPTVDQLQRFSQDQPELGRKALAIKLKKNMFAVMDPCVQKIIEAFGGAVAHHVVEGKKVSAEKSRQLLEDVGIDINDAANGIFLPDGPESIFIGPHHRTSHSEQYTEMVYGRLRPYKGNREKIIEELTKIKHDLYDGKMSLRGKNQIYNKKLDSDNRS
jgi:hypothetical protein